MAIGDIGDSALGTLNISDIRYTPSVLQVGEGYVAIVGFEELYYTQNENCWLKTYSITSDGSTITLVDSWEFTAANNDSSRPRIIKLPGATDKYIVAYNDGDNDGTIFTCTISTTGIITKSKIDTLSSTAVGSWANDTGPSIHHTGNVNDMCITVSRAGDIATFSVDSDGNISNSILDTAQLNPTGGFTPGDIVHLDGDYYAVTVDDVIDTFSIDSSGNITLVDTWKGAVGAAGGFLKVGTSTTYIIVDMLNPSTKVMSFTISNTGTITKSWIDTLTFGSGWCNPYLTFIDNDVFALNQVVSRTDYGISTFTCNSSGAISDSPIDSLIAIDQGPNTDMRAGQCNGPVRVNDSGIYVSAACTNESYDTGQLVSYKITEKPPPNPGGDINWCHTKVRG